MGVSAVFNKLMFFTIFLSLFAFFAVLWYGAAFNNA